MKTLEILLLLAVLAVLGGAGFIGSGLYDISATDQHLPPTYWAMEKAMRRSVALRGAGIDAPPLGAPGQLDRGLTLFRRHCVQCHGAPGVAPEPFALGLTPLPAPLAQTGREWASSEIFWVVKYGIKMTGMPAWAFRLSDEDIWAVVALVRELPRLSPQAYREWEPGRPAASSAAAEAGTPGDAERGRTALQQYACVGCHRIPGITGPDAKVGPPLAGIASRQMLAGVLPNTLDNLGQWIRAPQAVSPRTAMPDLGVTPKHARDMAAYLATLK